MSFRFYIDGWLVVYHHHSLLIIYGSTWIIAYRQKNIFLYQIKESRKKRKSFVFFCLLPKHPVFVMVIVFTNNIKYCNCQQLIVYNEFLQLKIKIKMIFFFISKWSLSTVIIIKCPVILVYNCSFMGFFYVSCLFFFLFGVLLSRYIYHHHHE